MAKSLQMEHQMLKAKKIKCMFLLAKLQGLPVSKIKLFGRWLTKHLFYATEHLPDKEESIFKVFKNCVVMLYLVKTSPLFQKKILSMQGFQQRSKWTTFLDNLTSLEDQNTPTLELLQISLQELISREKDCQPFWTSAYKELSENLLLPIGTDFVGLGSNSLNSWLQEQVEKSQFLTIQKTSLTNKNLQMTCFPSSMSSLVNKWALAQAQHSRCAKNEVMPTVKLKTLRIKIYPSKEQRKILDEFIDTSRYVYNRTLEFINNGHKANEKVLRDLLVTDNTKKGYDEYKAFDIELTKLREMKKTSEDKMQIAKLNEKIKEINQERRNKMKSFDAVKNPLVLPFETNTPKDIRHNAVKRCCNALKTGFTNLRNGNIKYFKMKYQKKTDAQQTVQLTNKIFSITNGNLRIAPGNFKDDCILRIDKHNQRKIKDLKIQHDVFIVRTNGSYSETRSKKQKIKKACMRKEYFVNIPIEVKVNENNRFVNVCGIDPGIRTFATVHSNNISTSDVLITEYKHKAELLKKLNEKLDLLKASKLIRKKQFVKIEKRKSNLVDKLHWDVINDILKSNDVVYFGDISGLSASGRLALRAEPRYCQWW